MEIACLDLEGVLVPEVWINFAERTGIDALRATTREIPDYDELMKMRLGLLAEHEFNIHQFQEVIDEMGPLDGAREFLDWLRDRMQVVILSDTFYQFAAPFMKQLGSPTLFCHELEIADDGRITDYHLRMPDQKREAVIRFRELKFETIAVGDSYNDTSMLGEADHGILFRPPESVKREFPQFPVTVNYEELKKEIEKALASLGE